MKQIFNFIIRLLIWLISAMLLILIVLGLAWCVVSLWNVVCGMLDSIGKVVVR